MATFLATCMLMGAVPATAFAAKETTEAAETIHRYTGWMTTMIPSAL